jgi:hypothetical protein
MALWVDLMDTAEQLLVARLQGEVKAVEDVRDAYRRWYQRQMEEHDRTMRQMAANFYRRGVRHGR